jgi:hypothetical protein
VLRWSEKPKAVFQYLTSGRVLPTLENTVGFFASAVCLPVRLSDSDTISDLLKRAMAEYCSVYEPGFSYMAAQVPRPEFAKSSGFNWITNGSQPPPPGEEPSGATIRVRPFSFVNPVLKSLKFDGEPWIAMQELEDDVIGILHFRESQVCAASMERFGRNFVRFAEELVRQPERRIKDLALI